MQIFRILFSATLLLIMVGCTADSPAPTTKIVKIGSGPTRDTDRARALNRRAADLITKSDFNGAEPILKQAITADAEFGPAQNNLGVVYFNQSKLYPAAQQFLLAAALLPHDPEPRNGLGLVFESSNRFDDAIAYYDRARALDPTNAEYLGNSARAHIRRGDRTDAVRSMLENIATNDTRPEWNHWARQTLRDMQHASATAPSDR